jgi:hypothetical protein
MKYKKNFLIDLLDLRKFDPTSRIYDAYVQFNDVTTKLNSFNQAYGKLDFDSPNEDTLKRAK